MRSIQKAEVTFPGLVSELVGEWVSELVREAAAYSDATHPKSFKKGKDKDYSYNERSDCRSNL